MKWLSSSIIWETGQECYPEKRETWYHFIFPWAFCLKKTMATLQRWRCRDHSSMPSKWLFWGYWGGGYSGEREGGIEVHVMVSYEFLAEEWDENNQRSLEGWEAEQRN